jgi:hypothetical protein
VTLSLADWYQKLEQDSRDWNLREVFADWLADTGLEVLERGQRWQVQHQKTPLSYLQVASYAIQDEPRTWWLGRFPNPSGYPVECQIEAPYFEKFRQAPELNYPARWKHYPYPFAGEWWCRMNHLQDLETLLARVLEESHAS